MRLIRVSCGVVAWSCLIASPALAQRGGHPMPHPPTHASTPAHVEESAPHAGPTSAPKTIVIKPALAARLQPLLPPQTNLETAAAGFRNQGQFVAALHVSRNLNIPFAQLKAEMVGRDHDSLGQAIHELRPAANSRAAVTTAERETNEDLDAAKSSGTRGGKDEL